MKEGSVEVSRPKLGVGLRSLRVRSAQGTPRLENEGNYRGSDETGCTDSESQKRVFGPGSSHQG